MRRCLLLASFALAPWSQIAPFAFPHRRALPGAKRG